MRPKYAKSDKLFSSGFFNYKSILVTHAVFVLSTSVLFFKKIIMDTLKNFSTPVVAYNLEKKLIMLQNELYIRNLQITCFFKMVYNLSIYNLFGYVCRSKIIGEGGDSPSRLC